MSGFRLSPEAEAQLDGIWLHIARESGNIDTAARVVDTITERFWLLGHHSFMGRRRDEDLAPGLRSFPADDYVIVYCVEKDEVAILHVFHGSQDIEHFFRH